MTNCSFSLRRAADNTSDYGCIEPNFSFGSELEKARKRFDDLTHLEANNPVRATADLRSQNVNADEDFQSLIIYSPICEPVPVSAGLPMLMSKRQGRVPSSRIRGFHLHVQPIG
jgi:hypothetical protein